MQKYGFLLCFYVFWAILFWASTQFPCAKLLFWSREAIQHGHFWGISTGHFVHLDAKHAQFNILAWTLCILLCQNQWSVGKWLVHWLFLSVVVSVGLYYFSPSLRFYGGASGILHGLLLELLLWRAVTEKKWIFNVLSVFLIAKIVLESALQMSLSSLFSTTKPHFLVVFHAHSFGALGGLLLFIFSYFLSQKNSNKIHETPELQSDFSRTRRAKCRHAGGVANQSHRSNDSL